VLIKQIVGPKPGPVNSTEYDVVYLQVYNNFAGTITAGAHVCFDPSATTAQWLGFAVTRPATANLQLYAGCCPVAIAQATWGLCVCYGVVEKAQMDGGTTDTAVGNTFTLFNGVFYVSAPTAGTQGSGWVVAMEAITTNALGRALIRAM
jgi:hypothetical protein